MKQFSNAIAKARQDAARYLTGQARLHALQHGWDSDVVRNIHVINEGSKWTAQVTGEHADRAFVHEYGDQDTRPTAALHKFANDKTTTDQALYEILDHHWKKGA